MKKLFTTFAGLVLITCIFAQPPQKMSYQCVIRNSVGVLVINQGVGIKISILQGTTTGTAVYQEIYNPNPATNSNGLVSVEIGGGLPLFGTFSTIDWGAGPYYLKTETDPTGGTNYTIAGTSQLLSVPYALHAKSVDSFAGIVAISNGGTGATTQSGAKTNLGLNNVDNTTDLLKPVSTATQTQMDLKAPLASPTFTGTVSGITGAMVGLGNVNNTSDLMKPVSTATQTALDLKAPLASPALTGTPSAPTATSGANTTQIATTAFVTSALNTRVPIHYIGENYGGGVVFYVYDNGQHGLIASTANADSPGASTWNNGINRYTNSNSNGLESGSMNTALIIALQTNDNPVGYFAARVCTEYWVASNGITYGGWYLPSQYELNLLYLQRAVVPNLSGIYWSSNESGILNAFVQNFSTGATSYPSKSATNFTRAIRAF